MYLNLFPVSGSTSNINLPGSSWLYLFRKAKSEKGEATREARGAQQTLICQLSQTKYKYSKKTNKYEQPKHFLKPETWQSKT